MDSVRVCLAGIGFGLIIAGLFGASISIASVVVLKEPTFGQRAALAAIGVVTVALMLWTRPPWRSVPLHRLTALLVSCLIGLLLAYLTSSLRFPDLTADRPHKGREGKWGGVLDYGRAGKHTVWLSIDAVSGPLLVSGRLEIGMRNGSCAFELSDSLVTPGKAVSMGSPGRSRDEEVCGAEDGAELGTEVDPSGTRMHLVLTGKGRKIAEGDVCRGPLGILPVLPDIPGIRVFDCPPPAPPGDLPSR
ncbi:PRA1 family protein [Sphaerisporangium corydalis]|uniref:Uncharacterized protein n=1 Tax=Sphaerisporangium corydalis TaxID=1441875 RepID=A0ABV9EJ50_9ACTN|nr:hypothetical protein [Sphaerisporangium corydalis]